MVDRAFHNMVLASSTERVTCFQAQPIGSLAVYARSHYIIMLFANGRPEVDIIYQRSIEICVGFTRTALSPRITMASISRSMLARRAFLSISNRQAIPLHHHHASAKGLTSILTSQHLQSSPSLLDQIPTKSTAVGSIRIASFHASSRNSIIPPPPRELFFAIHLTLELQLTPAF